MLAAEDIRFSYNGQPVLDKVNFTLDRGRFMCVLGVNGAGKSTLLKCLNRILKPQGGTVLLDGKDMFSMGKNSVAKRVGYVPQRHPKNNLTVFEAVLMGRKPHIRWSMSADDYKLTENVIRSIGMEHLALRPVSDLSGGEVQKVVIARALAQSPRVLLLDEPTSNLDLKNQLEVMGLVRRIVDHQGLSAIAAIHDLNIAVRFADTFLFLKNHSIHAIAGREDLTPDLIRQVYGVDVAISKVNGHTVVTPL